MARNGKQADGITVVGVEAESFKRLRFAKVKMVPGRGLVRISGRNGSGKTSLLRAIRAALGGAGEVNPEAVVNDKSADGTGQVRLELSNGFTVTRRFTEAAPKGYLTVLGPDGGKHGQSKLDEFLGPLSFDPCAFFQLHPDRQREILLSIGSDPLLPGKLAGLRAMRQAKYEERTPWISQKRRAGQVAKPAGDRPEPVDVSAELRRMGELQRVGRGRQDLIYGVERARENTTRLAREAVSAAKSTLTEATKRRTAANTAASAATSEVDRLKALLDEARATVQRAKEDVSEASLAEDIALAALQALPDPEAVAVSIPDPDLPPDPTAEMELVQVRIGEADAVRNSIEPWKAWEKAQVELAEATAAECSLTGHMDQLEADEQALIAAAGIGIPGLTFGDGGVPLLKSKPLSVASGAERSRLAVAVAMAANPDLRVCLLDEEANGLDLDALQELDSLAKEHGFQIWAARIGLEGRGEIVVEDGVAMAREDEQAEQDALAGAAEAEASANAEAGARS